MRFLRMLTEFHFKEFAIQQRPVGKPCSSRSLLPWRHSWDEGGEKTHKSCGLSMKEGLEGFLRMGMFLALMCFGSYLDNFGRA